MIEITDEMIDAFGTAWERADLLHGEGGNEGARRHAGLTAVLPLLKRQIMRELEDDAKAEGWMRAAGVHTLDVAATPAEPHLMDSWYRALDLSVDMGFRGSAIRSRACELLVDLLNPPKVIRLNDGEIVVAE